ncbi:hypothetical protein ACF0H5_018122 [Mactra antiquata]
MDNFNIIVTTFLVLCMVATVNAIQCFKCSTKIHFDDCRRELNSTLDTMFIEDNCQYCLKYDFKDTDDIIRNCTKKSENSVSFKFGCKDSKKGYSPSYRECACTSDFCNGGHSNTATVSFLLLVAMSVQQFLLCLSKYNY